MKKYLTGACMLFIPLAALAQENIEKIFKQMQEVQNIKTSVTNIHNENNGINAETKIIDFILSQQEWGICDNIREAFEKESGKPYMEWSCYDPISSDNTRSLWRIQRGIGDDIIIGEKKNSSFVIMCFNDPSNSDCRTVYSAEWWKMSDPNYRQGRLVYSYGEKPKTQKATTFSINKHLIKNGDNERSFFEGFDSLFTKGYHVHADSILKRFRNDADSISKNGNFTITFHDNPDDDWSRFDDHLHIDDILNRHNNSASSTLFDNDFSEWMNGASKKMSKLTPSEWMRFFGLLTDQMESNPDQRRNLIVSSGLVLDLCKNVPSKLSEEERAICSSRLLKLGNLVKKKNEYAHDILMLCLSLLEK